MENEELKDSRDAGRLDEPQSSRASKRGLLAAIIALAVVIAVGFFAYNALSSSRSQTPSSPSAEAKSEWAEPSGTGPMLADYDATVYTESGAPFAFSEIADGKPLVVNYWATWCPYCVKEMPDYLEIYRDYSGRVGSVPIVGVTTSFGRRGLQPARANGASPGTVILHQHHAALPSFSSMAAMT